MNASNAPASQPHPKEPSGASRMFGDFAPGLAAFTDDVLLARSGPARNSHPGTAAWSPWQR